MTLMMKIRIVIIFSLVLVLQPSYAFLSKGDLKLYSRLRIQYSWLTLNLFHIIYFESKLASFDTKLVAAIIHGESEGINKISKRNKDGSHDYGLMQYNSKNMRKGEEKLYLNPNLNIRSGISYFKDCIKTSNGRLDDSIRLYNQGLNGKRDKYKKWSYVKRIFHNYYRSLNI